MQLKAKSKTDLQGQLNIMQSVTNDPKIVYAINKAIEYMANVVFTQKRFIAFDDMYIGYKSVMKNAFTKQSFQIVYDAYKETLLEKELIG